MNRAWSLLLHFVLGKKDMDQPASSHCGGLLSQDLCLMRWKGVELKARKQGHLWKVGLQGGLGPLFKLLSKLALKHMAGCDCILGPLHVPDKWLASLVTGLWRGAARNRGGATQTL